MFTDIAGFTALSRKDEAMAMTLLEDHRNIIRPMLTRYNGREVKTIGDAFLVEFGSALEAVR
jgi:adenylate cyclase